MFINYIIDSILVIFLLTCTVMAAECTFSESKGLASIKEILPEYKPECMKKSMISPWKDP